MIDTAVIGYGVIGKTTASAFGIEKWYSRTQATTTFKEMAKYRFIFGCLPTPFKDNGYDTSTIEATVKQLQEEGFGGIFINRSTVIPGFAKYLMSKYNIPIVSNPEFLTEATADFDAKHPELVVIGGEDPNHIKAVKGLYEARFKGVDYIETDTTTAEMIKISVNGFYTTKVVFANEIYNLCQNNGANYLEIKNAIYKLKFGTKNHFDIFHKGGRGAGGKCLRKDFNALTAYSDSELFKMINQRNEQLLSGYPKTE